MPSEYKETKIQYKYSTLPDEPKYVKKKKKKKIKKSNHKHQYEKCIFRIKKYANLNLGEYFNGTYCPICGRIDNVTWEKADIDNITWEKPELHKNLPIFEIDSFFDKFIPFFGD